MKKNLPAETLLIAERLLNLKEILMGAVSDDELDIIDSIMDDVKALADQEPEPAPAGNDPQNKCPVCGNKELRENDGLLECSQCGSETTLEVTIYLLDQKESKMKNSNYDLSKKEIKKIDKELKKVIKTKSRKALMRFARPHPHQERPTETPL